MCLPPFNEDPKQYFVKLKEIAQKHNLSSLSMGMSGDYEEAIKCGATHIRIGTKSLVRETNLNYYTRLICYLF